MNSLAHQVPLSSLRLSVSSSSWRRFSRKESHNHKFRALPVVSSAASTTPISNAQTKERLKLKQLFKEAYERCCTTPMDGVSFTLEDFHAALSNYDFVSELGTKVNLPFQFPSAVYMCSFLSFFFLNNKFRSFDRTGGGHGSLLMEFRNYFLALSTDNRIFNMDDWIRLMSTHELLSKSSRLTQMEIITLQNYLIV